MFILFKSGENYSSKHIAQKGLRASYWTKGHSFELLSIYNWYMQSTRPGYRWIIWNAISVFFFSFSFFLWKKCHICQVQHLILACNIDCAWQAYSTFVLLLKAFDLFHVGDNNITWSKLESWIASDIELTKVVSTNGTMKNVVTILPPGIMISVQFLLTADMVKIKESVFFHHWLLPRKRESLRPH